jgi:hypothetical protein
MKKSLIISQKFISEILSWIRHLEYKQIVWLNK